MQAEATGDGLVVDEVEMQGVGRSRTNRSYATVPNPANLGETAASPGPSRLCVRVLTAITIALAIDVVIMTGYIYQKEPPSVGGVSTNPGIADESSTAATGGDGSSSRIEWAPLPHVDSVLTKVAFGSCASQRMPQPYWDTLAEYEPQLSLLMGDQVYGDCEEESCEILRQAYRDFAEIPSLLGAAGRLPVMATLDDHDYGANDCHADNPYKEIARELFADFFQLENLPDDGVYQSGVWGPPGQRLRIILLDTRYGRSPFVRTGIKHEPFQPVNATAPQQMLSEKQWQWFQHELENDPADLNVVVSSIQVLNDWTGEECWRHLPTERQRLYELIREKPVVLLSGDRHMGGFYETADGNINEVTASAWTHSVPLFIMKGCNSSETCDEPDPRRIGPFVRENNFGTIEIDWANKNYTLALRRAESSYGVSYLEPHRDRTSDAGEILESKAYSFA